MTVLHQKLRNDCAAPKNPNLLFSSALQGFYEFFMYPGLSKSSVWFLQSSMYPGLWSFVQFTIQPIFYFDPLSKVFMNSSLTLPMILNLVFSKLHSGYGHASCLISKLSWGTAYHFLHPFVTWAGSHQKFTWHWAFSSIPKRITSSTHLATVISVEAKKNEKLLPTTFPPWL